jgi:hypothetical protein
VIENRRTAWRCLLALIGLIWLGQSARAENKYDVLAHVLQPYGALFYSKSSLKAMQADVVLQDASGTNGALAAGSLLHRTLRVSLQMPDRLRIETVGPGNHIIFCRQGQQVWIYPRVVADRVIAAAGPPGPATSIPDFHLPLRDNQIVLLPALFQISSFQPAKDAENQPAWSIDLHPATELIQSDRPPPWNATVVVRQKDYQIRHLTVRSPEWTGRLQVLFMRFMHALPPELWSPAPTETAGAEQIPPALYSTALARLSTINFEP